MLWYKSLIRFEGQTLGKAQHTRETSRDFIWTGSEEEKCRGFTIGAGLEVDRTTRAGVMRAIDGPQKPLPHTLSKPFVASSHSSRAQHILQINLRFRVKRPCKGMGCALNVPHNCTSFPFSTSLRQLILASEYHVMAGIIDQIGILSPPHLYPIKALVYS